MIKCGERALIAINGGGATLQITRPRNPGDKVFFVLYSSDVEKVAADPLPTPVASWWTSVDGARDIKGVL